jgi:ribosome-binding factor A
MTGPSRQSRVGDQIRVELAEILARQVQDPGIGFLTITHVKMTPDLQQARVYYTTIGDEKARRDTARALARALPFLRRQVGQRLHLRRVPELQFFFDESVEKQDRIERILLDLERERAEQARLTGSGEEASVEPPGAPDPGLPPDDETHDK